MTKQRLTLISVVGLLVFSLLFGGQFLYKKNWVDKSIQEQSRQIPGVISATVVQENGQQVLNVATKQIPDLHQAARDLLNLAGGRPIRLLDTRTPKLEQLLNQMQFALQEGVVRGNFTEMAQSVKDQAEKAGVKFDLTMDSDYIYLELNDQDGQLVTVLERRGQGLFLPSAKN
ncbi:hypothetical protein [Paradesulfitobacterium ferrireducens]|uniref:hypothetical protein n=1 Tax=Paradesulfitobacterium ferrireducens TaxID=2816476 RepID=UPI001A8C6D11|nr:hypothetical protein [Paradesulfitobacterium ferrireducens]